MANLAAIAGSYFFLLFNADGVAGQVFWPTVVGVGWIVLMTYICYIGIEISARVQYALLRHRARSCSRCSRVVALVRVYTNNAVDGRLTPPGAVVVQPLRHPEHSERWPRGLLLAVFIYWGFDTAVSVNEETKDARKTPGRAAVIATLVLLGDLRRRDDRHPGVRRHRHDRHRAGKPEQRRRRVLGARQGGVRQQRVRHASPCTC